MVPWLLRMPARFAPALLLALLGGQALAAPLAGRIWVPDDQRFAEPGEVEAAVANARYVLLGEEHPLARHHQLQARLIRAAAQRRRPAVVFEMIPRSRQAAIDAWRQAPQPDAATLGPAVAWAERGWPDWSLYAPVAAAALAHDLPLVAGAPAPVWLRRVAREGLTGLTGQRRRVLRLERPLPADGRERLLATLREAHCGELHAPAGRMLAIQRLRDATMAVTMRGAGKGGAVLVAGHGHVRHDYGVPRYLAAARDEVLAIAFRGTRLHADVENHVAAAGGALPYDYVWFTEGGAGGPKCDDDNNS